MLDVGGRLQESRAHLSPSVPRQFLLDADGKFLLKHASIADLKVFPSESQIKLQYPSPSLSAAAKPPSRFPPRVLTRLFTLLLQPSASRLLQDVHHLPKLLQTRISFLPRRYPSPHRSRELRPQLLSDLPTDQGPRGTRSICSFGTLCRESSLLLTYTEKLDQVLQPVPVPADGTQLGRS